MNKVWTYPFSIEEKKYLKKTRLLNHILIYPTDTFYAIGCRADKDQLVQRVYHLKKRKFTSPMLVLINSWDMLNQYANIEHPSVSRLLSVIWPGSCTVILKIKEKLSSYLNNNQNILAFRMIKHPITDLLIDYTQVPLVGTSANFSGDEAVSHPSLIPQKLKDKINVLVNGGHTVGKAASTVLDVSTLPNLQILRTGAVKSSQIYDLIQENNLPFNLSYE